MGFTPNAARASPILNGRRDSVCSLTTESKCPSPLSARIDLNLPCLASAAPLRQKLAKRESGSVENRFQFLDTVSIPKRDSNLIIDAGLVQDFFRLAE
jgi:hypothetical protein